LTPNGADIRLPELLTLANCAKARSFNIDERSRAWRQAPKKARALRRWRHAPTAWRTRQNDPKRKFQPERNRQLSDAKQSHEEIKGPGLGPKSLLRNEMGTPPSWKCAAPFLVFCANLLFATGAAPFTAVRSAQASAWIVRAAKGQSLYRREWGGF
jgi:hypothetical protein